MTKSGVGVHSGLFIDDERTEWADFSVPFHEVQTGIIYNQNIDPSMTLTEAEGLILYQEGSYRISTLLTTILKWSVFNIIQPETF